jgi:hypothetical protein
MAPGASPNPLIVAHPDSDPARAETRIHSIRAELHALDWTPDLPIYASASFLRTLSREHGWLAGVNEDGRLRCVLPFARLRKAGLRLIRFATETLPLGGPLGLEEEREFLNRAVEHFRAAGDHVIIPGTFTSLFRQAPDGAIACGYGSYVVDLGQTEEAIWAGLHQKHRNVIRAAEKKGVTVRRIPGVDELIFNLIKGSFVRSAKSWVGALRVRLRMRLSDFQRQAEALGPHSTTFLAEHEGRPQGCAVIHFSRHSAYYMHGGAADHPVTGAMNLVHWEAMRQLRAEGVREYNFVGARLNPEPGSKQEGLARFKERFGGELRRGCMWKFHLRPGRARLYELLGRIRSGGDVVDQVNRSQARQRRS